MELMKPQLGRQLRNSHAFAGGLRGCWLMNEGGGNIVSDLSGNGNLGTLTGSLSWSRGQYGPCLESTGSGNYVLAPISRVITYPFSYAISYLQKTVIDNYIVGIADSSVANHWNAILLNEVSGASWIRHQYANAGGTEYTQKGTDIGSNKWQSIVVVQHSASSADIYLDGLLWFNNPDSTYTPDPTLFDRFGIMCIPDATPVATTIGQSQWACLYNRALTAGEISQLYREPFCMFEGDL